MINLKLAEYNSEGKFERFLEIGKDFVYGGYYILITEKMTLLGVLGLADTCSFNRDEKDPLNRFDGLFNGFTYGNGRFVLIEKIDDGWQDDLVENEFNKRTFLLGRNYEPFFMRENYRNYEDYLRIKACSNYIGNLHQNPELYEKVKNNEL